MSNGPSNKAPSNAVLTLTVLGKASLSYILPNQELTQVLGPGKPLALLVYLSHLPSKTATRDHMLDLLWSNQDPSMGRPALRQAIWYIRQRIGSNGVESGDGMIRLAIELESDADRFEHAIEAGDLERAVRLYGGPFLPDLAIPGGAEFEHWANAERSRLESLFLRSAEVVTGQWLSQGQFQRAEKLARKVREMNRTKQAWWRLLLEVLTSAGDPVRATVEADDLERMLASEGIAPDRTTAEAIRLARQMPATPDVPASKGTLFAELVGREREFATIIRAWEDAKKGSGRHVAVIAAAGLGKTRLLTDVHMRLHASGVQTVHLRANAGERQIDFSLASNLAGALSQLPGSKGIPPACAATLVALNPALSSCYQTAPASTKESDALRVRTIALSDLLAAVAHEQPVAVLIDDLHWIDERSRGVLGGFAPCFAGIPALLLTASRPATRGPLQDSAQEEITLPPLSQEHVVALASSIGSLPDEDWVKPALRSLRDENGGSPLLVLESLQLALDRGSLQLVEGSWSCDDGDELVAEFQGGGALRNRVSKLDRSESWVLLILAVAGMPLSIDRLARMTGRTEPSLMPALATLEQKGFVTRVGDEFEPAHDEIGSLAIELAADDAGPAASGAVGRVLAGDAADNEQLLLRAGQLLASADDRGRLNEVFRRRLWLARNRGERRRTRDLAREILGNRYSENASKRLFKDLPLYFRLGLTSVRRIAGAATAFVCACVAVVAILAWPDGPPPEAVFVAYTEYAIDEGSPLGETLDRAGWMTIDQVSLAPGADAPDIRSIHGTPVPSPDGRQWAFSRITEDSGEIDVFVVDREGNERRLTNTPNDDGPHDWSPDGSKLLMVTSRWNPEEIYEAAILDVNTSEVVRLTDSPHNEGYLRWNPDGTRIAYTRRMLGGDISELCWTTPNAAPPICVEGFSASLGWRSESDVLVVAGFGADTELGWFNLVRRDFVALEPKISQSGSMVASRDGNWVAMISRDSVSGKVGWSVFPVDAPDQPRAVIFRERRAETQEVGFLTPRHRDSYLDRLTVDAPPTALPVGVPLLLHATGTDIGGRRIPLLNLDWNSGGSSVASVEPMGVIRPHRPGEVTVSVSAGGWREDTRALSVADPWFNVVFTEEWSDGWDSRLIPYGAPPPLVTLGPESIPGFWNNGDRSFTSGAYSANEWPAEAGLGIEALISTSITAPHQQRMTFSLSGWIDSARVAGWDHRTGHLPGRDASSDRTRCQVLYPDRGAVREREIQMSGGGPAQTVTAPLSVDTGDWHRVRLQIFPDGTCGLAINGQVLARSRNRVPFDTRYRVWTEGASLDSKMLVGPLEVWTGVRTDVDWAALDWPD